MERGEQRLHTASVSSGLPPPVQVTRGATNTRRLIVGGFAANSHGTCAKWSRDIRFGGEPVVMRGKRPRYGRQQQKMKWAPWRCPFRYRVGSPTWARTKDLRINRWAVSGCDCPVEKLLTGRGALSEKGATIAPGRLEDTGLSC